MFHGENYNKADCVHISRYFVLLLAIRINSVTILENFNQLETQMAITPSNVTSILDANAVILTKAGACTVYVPCFVESDEHEVKYKAAIDLWASALKPNLTDYHAASRRKICDNDPEPPRVA
jgi:hypothetical protein